jgi:hypothetical protein
LNGIPNPLGRDLAIGELVYGLHARQAVPDLHQPVVVSSDQVGELHFAGEVRKPGLLGGFARGMDGDVVFGINRKVFHFGLISLPGKDRGDHIHHSQVLEKQGDYARNRLRRRAGDGEEKAGPQVAPDCVR